MNTASAPLRSDVEAACLGLGYLASGLLGRSLAILSDPTLEEDAWTDGLIMTVRDANGPETSLAVMVQAALIRSGSLAPRIVARLVGRPDLTRRYLAVEAPRVLRALSDRLPRRLSAHPALRAGSPASDSPEQSLRIALGKTPLATPHRLFGGLRPGRVLRNGRTLAELAATVSAGGELKENEPALDADEAAEDSKILKVFSNLAGGGPLADLFKKIIGVGSQASADETDAAGAGEDLSEAAGRKRSWTAVSAGAGRTARQGHTAEADNPGVRHYREWDESSGRYRPDWTRVEDVVPWNPDDMLDLPVLDAPSRKVRAQLARLGLGFERHRRQAAGDEIVMDDVVRLVIDARSGHAGDPRIYRALLKTRRDLGVLLLIDASSSVKDLTSDGRSILSHQIEVAWQLSAALEAAGDRTAIFGFNSWGRKRVRLLRVKSFNDRMGGLVVDRLRHMTPAGFTRMGAAVRHAGRVLKSESGMPFKLVILISDGLSYDDGYEAGQAEADTRRSIAELQTDHIACLCLCVGSDAGADKLKRVFGDAAFLQAQGISDVAPRLKSLFAAALASIYAR